MNGRLRGLAEMFARQSVACGRLGSPMYEAMLSRAADELGAGGPLDRVLAGHEEDPESSALALRLVGTVHRLVLEGRAGPLARYYPSVGGCFDPDALWPALLTLLDEQREAVADGLTRPPQTNEVGRSAALIGLLLRLGAAELPLRLFELGASAGLNLRADHFRCSGTGGDWGPVDSPVQLLGAWEGAATPTARRLRIVERVGCDSSPIDPTSAQGRLLLTAYVWPDQQERLERLEGALEIAARVPAEVHTQRAGDLMTGLRLRSGHCTVVWHSVMWQYVDAGERAVVREHLARLAAQSSDDAPFAHLYLEPTRHQPDAERDFLVGSEQWPAGPGTERRVLGASRGHGLPVTWER